MTWPEVGEDTWSLPGERTKNGKPHIVPLSMTAREILDNVPKINGSDFVFTINGKRPVSGWGRAKERLDKIAGVEGWTLHDLRRTLVTGMNEDLGIEPHVVEACLNHLSGGAKAGVAGVYNRAQYLPQRKVALESWAQHIAGIVGGAAESNVVDFGKKR
jgi:integrase